MLNYQDKNRIEEIITEEIEEFIFKMKIFVTILFYHILISFNSDKLK